ncbi:MAG: hypothetical protein ABI315_09645 [Bacteroidia bacterium]
MNTKKKQILYKMHAILLCIIIISCNQQSSKNKLLILGTVHFPTKEINADSIYTILEKYNPDIILMEAESSVFNDDYTFRKMYDQNEFNSVKKYLSHHPSVQIRPIEFEGRNEYRKKLGIFSEAGDVYRKIEDLYQSKKLTNAECKMWDDFTKLWQKIDSLSNSNLNAINNSTSDEIVENASYYQYIKLKEIIDRRIEFTSTKIIDSKNDSVSLKEYFAKWSDFENGLRNKKMTENIVNIVQNNSNKKIIVLTGFKHRYSLLKRFKTNNQSKDILELIELHSVY